MSRSGLIARNAAFLFGGQAVTWALGLVFIVIVPRSVGASAWGEWTLAWALTSVAAAVTGLGLSTLLVKEISRDRERAADYVGAALFAQAMLAAAYAALVLGFTHAARYGAHTQLIITLVTGAGVVTFLTVPITAGLQALEKMQFTSLGQVISSGLLSLIAILLVKVAAVGMIAISVAAFSATVFAGAVQWYGLSQRIQIRPRFDRALVRHMIVGGLPYWASGLFLSFYVWIDTVLLSIMTSTTEVGWYGAATKLISTLGILPFVVNMAVFPALSHSYRHDRDGMARLAQTSLRIVLSVGLPMVAGVVLVGPQIMRLLYGWAFEPAAPIVVVLSLTLLPIFIATLVNGQLIAVDRQLAWTGVMAACCVVNPALNLVMIGLFERLYHNGALGASYALLITDTLVGVAAVALLPRDVLGRMRPILAPVGRAAVATWVMGVAVWALRDTFVLIPIIAGAGVFIASALLLRVFTSSDLNLARHLGARLLARVRVLRPRRAVVPPRIAMDNAVEQGGNRPLITVAICTRDRADHLAAAVESVADQAFPGLEVIVVDQSETTATADVVHKLMQRYPSVRYMQLAEVGLSRARNWAIEHARGDLVAFTDDDCQAPPGWLQRMAGCFEDRDVDLVFGQVVAPPDLAGREGLDGVTPVLPIQRRERLDRRTGFKVFGMGANCGVRKAAWARVGGFDIVLGAGGPLLSGEDFDFSYRVFRTGGAILLEPELVIVHRGFRPIADWPKTVRDYGLGVGSFYFKHVRMGDLRVAGMLARTLLRETAGATRKLIRAKPARNQWSYTVNLLRGMARSLDYDIDPHLRIYRRRAESRAAA